MKTLVITYLLRGEQSNTKKLADCFLANAKNTEVEYLDLSQKIPESFTSESLTAYMKRNYMKIELTESEKKSIHAMDELTNQLKGADVVVLAFPLYNFSMPGIVKVYFDAILQKGETWDMKDGSYVGLMKDKKALIIMTSGGVYDGPMASWEHGMSLAKLEFGFMGFKEIESVHIGGVNMGNTEEKIEAGKSKVKEIAAKWFK